MADYTELKERLAAKTVTEPAPDAGPFFTREVPDPLAAEALRAIQALEEERNRMRKALTIIERWELPPSGHFWTNIDGSISDRPMSYGSAFGSNGERDYMRRIARHTLGGET